VQACPGRNAAPFACAFNGESLGLASDLVARKVLRRLPAIGSRVARAVCGALIASAAALATSPARAQSQTFYLDRAQISGAPDDGFMVWRPNMYDRTRFYGMLALGYTNRPLKAGPVAANSRVEDEIDTLVKRQLTTYLSVGTEIAGRVGLNASLPIVLYQQGPSPDPVVNQVGNGLSVNGQAISDLRLDARVLAYRSTNRRFKLGVGGAMWLPTGNSEAFTSDNAITGYLYGSGEYDFGKFFVAGTVGPQFRPDRDIGGTNNALFVGSELRWAFGLYVPLRNGRIRLGAELWGTTGITSSAGSTFFGSRNTDLEWLAQARFALGKSQRTYIDVGGGTMTLPGYGAPDFRLLASIGSFFTLSDTNPKSPPPKYSNIPAVSNSAKDTDGDGFPDDVDQCPLVPGPVNGCPRAAPPPKDTDNDGIPDVEDACPKEPGPPNPDPKKNGCPQLTHVTENGEVELLKPIQFEFAKATIKPVSYPILDEVVTLMKARPNIRIGVYGNTDNKGSHDLNMRLSKARAASVVQYLEQHGIATSRLESDGFGPDKPIASNDTAEGRAKNRRVEFKILNNDSGGD
jgi:OmpA-OmpF porin, OOP family